MNNPIRIKIDLEKTPEGWIARLEGASMTDPTPTAHEALEDMAHVLRQFYEVARKPKEKTWTIQRG